MKAVVLTLLLVAVGVVAQLDSDQLLDGAVGPAVDEDSEVGADGSNTAQVESDEAPAMPPADDSVDSGNGNDMGLPTSAGYVSPAKGKIEHVVVLMLENRAFDHMLGWLKRVNPDIDGLDGTEYNLLNTSDPNSQKFYVNDQAAYVDPDPDHSIPGTTEQIFGMAGYHDPAPMSGFVENANKHFPAQKDTVVSCFDQQSVPVISELALNFALFDQYHASIPGPTMPNRAYVGSATSHGAGDNDVLNILFGYPQKSIFQHLNDSGKSWGIYFEEIPSMLQFADVRALSYLEHNFKFLQQFAQDCADDALPNYSFVEPIYFDSSLFAPANDQHPSHDVSEGEKLIKYVYESLRNSSSWNNTLLLVTYDEHGGFYDHVPTPLKHVPNPDGINCTDPAFDFQRLGVRVPMIAISPYIDAQVVHEPNGPTPHSHYEHSSVVATVKNIFGLPGFLTERDAWAGTFDWLLNRESPRTDCPETLAMPKPLLHKTKPPTGNNVINGFQSELVALAAGIVGEQPPQTFAPMTEQQASQFVREKVAAFLGRKNPGTPKSGLLG